MRHLRLFLASILFSLGAGSAIAQTTRQSLSTVSWTDVCQAPCSVKTVSGLAALVVDTSLPSTTDVPSVDWAPSNGLFSTATAGAHVYARAISPGTSVASVPYSAGGSSGGGGSGTTPVVGSLEQDIRSTQTLNAATANAAVTVPVNGQGTLGFTITGLTASGATLTFEQSEDGGTTWTIVNEVNAGTGVATSTRTTDGQTRIATSGRTNIRFRVSATGTGTITITYNLSVREGMVALTTPLPPGSNTIGSIANPFNLETTQQSVATSNSAISAATGTQADAATTSGSNTSIVGALRAIRDRILGTLTTTLAAGTNVIGKVGIDQTTPGTTNGVQVTNQATQTTAGAIEPPTAAAGKITKTSTALTANASTTIAVANASRIALAIQCGSGGVSVDETGAALTAAGVGNGTLFIPTGTGPYFTPPIATRTALTAYTATAQTCVVTEYNR